jgi:hypothetical protein
MLVITGAELAVDPLAPGRFTEILAIGIDEIPEDPGGDRVHWEPIDNYFFKTFPDLSTAGAFIQEQGGAAFIAHPSWSGLPPQVVLDAQHVHGLEVFNASAQRDGERGDSSYVWNLALEAGRPLTGIATDDCHYPGFDIGDAWTMIRAAERSPEAVIAALRQGSFYATSGPRIADARRDGPSIEVVTSPCASVVLHSRFEAGWAVHAGHRGRQEGARILERGADGSIVRAEFTPDIEVPFVRIVARDGLGRAAWSNPI